MVQNITQESGESSGENAEIKERIKRQKQLEIMQKFEAQRRVCFLDLFLSFSIHELHCRHFWHPLQM